MENSTRMPGKAKPKAKGTSGARTRASSARLAVVVFAALLASGCGVLPPPESDSRRAVEKLLTSYGEIVDFSAGPGGEAKKARLPDVCWAVPFRATVKLRDQVFWQTPGSMHYEIEGYRIPGKLMALSEFTPKFQEDLLAGRVPKDHGGNKYSSLPAGTLYVCQGNVVFKPVDEGYVLDEVIPKRRGTCPSGEPAACYAEHGIPAPGDPAR